MLALLGFLMIVTFLFLVITKRLSVVVAFIGVAVVFALIGGFYADMGEMMMAGIIKVTPTAVMIVFAILMIINFGCLFPFS